MLEMILAASSPHSAPLGNGDLAFASDEIPLLCYFYKDPLSRTKFTHFKASSTA